jgi:hypothetical protein
MVPRSERFKYPFEHRGRWVGLGMLWDIFDMLRYGLPSGWAIAVWDCRGSLIPTDSDAYGKMMEMMAEKKLTWLDIGYFRIPVYSNEFEKWDRNERLKKKIEGWCWKVIRNRGGAINWSGVYPVYSSEFDEFNAIIVKYSESECDLSVMPYIFQN